MTAPTSERWRSGPWQTKADAERYIRALPKDRQAKMADFLGLELKTSPLVKAVLAQEKQAEWTSPPLEPSHVHGALCLTLPYPPSVNAYWRSTLIRIKPKKPHDPPYRAAVFVSTEGKVYRRRVVQIMAATPAAVPAGSRLAVHAFVNPPDRRARDLDNLGKGLLDSLTAAGVWADDSLIDVLTFQRGPVLKGGQVKVTITPLDATLFEEHAEWSGTEAQP